MSSDLDGILTRLPRDYAGPGGAVALLRRGQVLARQSWGWADAEARVPLTCSTPFLICSITKQFTCALLLDRFADLSVLDEDVQRVLPDLTEPAPGALALCHNQSGLRDYWAVAMLCGAPVEGRFDHAQARTLIGRTTTLQFEPGSRYSYANQNFRILSDIIEQRLDRDFGELMRAHVLDPAEMPNARLNPDTSRIVGGTVGYEGSVETGFRPAVNRITWTGDAGLSASLDDMIAWEEAIDAARDQTDGIYNRLTAPAFFRDGRQAAYGFGLSRVPLLGHPATSHGGGLRGWRSFRAYLPGPRVSVVVMFNHMADARAAGLDLLGAVVDPVGPDPSAVWAPAGRYQEPETGLAVRIEPERLLYSAHPETPGAGSSTRLRMESDGVWMDRAAENQSTRLIPIEGTPASDIQGMFHCAELGADFTCVSAGGVLYGAFSGFLGLGAMQALLPFGPDLWLLPCPRALDFSPPGEWTLRFRRDGNASVHGVQVGCWLARRLEFRLVASGRG